MPSNVTERCIGLSLLVKASRYAAMLPVMLAALGACAPHEQTVDRPLGEASGSSVLALASCRLDPELIRREFHQDSRIVVLLAAGNTAPPDRRKDYKEMAEQAFICAAQGSRVELLPITDVAVGAASTFSGTVPGASPTQSNPLRIALERQQFVARGSDALGEILATKHRYGGSDPLGALYSAGELLQRSTTSKRVVIMISNGWQQTRSINEFRYRHNPASHASVVIRKLRSDGILPNLTSTDVLVVGITMGDPRLVVDGAQFAGVCRFWQSIIDASKGTMVQCGRTLPGLPSAL